MVFVIFVKKFPGLNEKLYFMKKFLVISPHPDDLDFGCAGTIAKLTKAGNIVEELIVSDGSKGNHAVSFSGKKLALVRKKEEESAAKVLGVQKVYFLQEIIYLRV